VSDITWPAKRAYSPMAKYRSKSVSTDFTDTACQILVRRAKPIYDPEFLK